MKSHRHILSKRARKLHREQVKNQGRLSSLVEEVPTVEEKNITFARRVLRTASRIASWYKKEKE